MKATPPSEKRQIIGLLCSDSGCELVHVDDPDEDTSERLTTRLAIRRPSKTTVSRKPA
jgi:hypothetical protein